MSSIHFSYADVAPVNLADKKKLKQFIERLFKQEGKKLDDLSYIFCTDEYLLQLNRSFLQHDYYTDILTFDLSDGDSFITGEIYISTERVKDNAQEHGESFNSEMLRVIFHGALHLCGYGDKTKSEIKAMRDKEDDYLQQFQQ